MSTWESTTKPILVLTLSALVVSLLLALVNAVTAPVIENNQKGCHPGRIRPGAAYCF